MAIKPEEFYSGRMAQSLPFSPKSRVITSSDLRASSADLKEKFYRLSQEFSAKKVSPLSPQKMKSLSATPRHTPSVNFLRKIVSIDQVLRGTSHQESDLLVCIYLCTCHGKIKGNLVLNDEQVAFQPLHCFENPPENLSRFACQIDYHDIADCFQVQLFNETGFYVHTVHKKNYMYDFYLQIDLLSVSPRILPQQTVLPTSSVSLNSHPDEHIEEDRQPEASVFFRFSHREEGGRLLTIKDQRRVVEMVIKAIKAKQ